MMLLLKIGQRALLTVLIVILLLATLGWATGFFASAAAVATGMGAKLLCSAEYVMHQDRGRALQDLEQYSGLLKYLTVSYNNDTRSITADFFGSQEKTATFLPGLGCAIDDANYETRRRLAVPVPITSASGLWPAGPLVPKANASLQTLVNELIQQDNSEGLNTRALLVVHRGQVLAEAYAQGATATTPLLGWSMAKSMTAVMLGNLEYRGLLDDVAAPLFTSWAQDARARIDLTDLLTMTDGIDFSEAYIPGDDATAMLFNSPSVGAYAIARSSGEPPGTRFNYSSGTANILAYLYSEFLGGPQSALNDFADNIARPLGLQNAVFEVDASGRFIGSSYLYASARDWARLGQLMLAKGEINGYRLLSEDWVDRATTPNTSDNYRAYGYQWWLNRGNETLRFPELPADTFFASGNRRQFLMVFPSHDTIIVRLGWTDGDYPVAERFQRVLTALDS